MTVTMTVLEVVIKTTLTPAITMVTRYNRDNLSALDVNAHLHCTAPRRPIVAAVQQHVHAVPRHWLHRLLAELQPERRQPPRHRPLYAYPASESPKYTAF